MNKHFNFVKEKQPAKKQVEEFNTSHFSTDECVLELVLVLVLVYVYVMTTMTMMVEVLIVLMVCVWRDSSDSKKGEY